MPLVSKTFNQLLDFTRTSAATFVGSDGLIRTTSASRNLLTFTQEFDNAGWAKSGSTVAANTTVAPDGTTTADTADFPANLARVERVVSGLTTASYTFSVYVKGTSGQTVNVELGSAAQTVTLNGDWQRISVTNSGSTSYTLMVIRRTTSATSVSLWGAQLEAAATATDYTRNNGGVFPPRFDYDPVTLAPKGLLIEEQRTNLLVRSAEFDNATWQKSTGGVASAPTVTADFGTSPDGTNNADRVQFALNGGTASADRSLLSQTATIVNATSYTFSVWLRSLSGTVAMGIGMDGVAGNTPITVTSTWQRFTLTGTSTGTAGLAWLQLRGAQTPTQANAADVLIYGAQLEAGAFPTSYIPTVASQVTRTADQTSIVAPNFAPWFNPNEGTFVVEADVVGSFANYPYMLSLSGQQGMFIQPTGILGVGRIFSNDAVTANTTALNTVIKAAGAYSPTNPAVAVLNGGAVGTGTEAWNALADQLRLGANGINTRYINGHIRRIRYYPTRLTNAQLQALTA